MTEELGQIGKYRLIRKIAQGGMAEIYLAEQTGPGGFNKRLVIKRILPHLADDEKFVEMFLDEARIAAQFNNPNIVQIYDLGQVDDQYFIAMEYIDGYDLSRIQERASSLGRRVPPPILARMIADALSGLSYAHNFKDPSGQHLNLVHRDISPHNILVNLDGVAKLVDFGVAKARTSTVKTQTGAVKGKFSYMAPEQIAGEDLDGRCDIFAMGITLFEVAMGHRPFGSDNDLMALTAIINDPPPRPTELVESFPAELEGVIMKSLEKRREDRYPSALDMQRDLEAYLQRAGLFITTREVSAYIEDLFSDNPSLDAIGLGASQTAAFSAVGAPAASPSNDETPGPTVNVPSPFESPTDSHSSPTLSSPSLDGSEVVKKNNSGLIVALVVIALLVLGVGGYFAYMLLGTSDDSDDGGSGTAEAATPGEGGDDGEETGDGGEDPGDSGGEPTNGGGDPGADRSGDGEEGTSGVGSGDTGGEPADTGEKASNVEQQPETDEGGEIGEPIKTPKGFGALMVASNFPAEVFEGEGKKVGEVPGQLNLAKGPHDLTFKAKNGASKTLSLTVIERRIYDVDVEFKRGKLEITTEPAGVEVKVDGSRVGKTPIKNYATWEGTRAVELIHKGKSYEVSIAVSPVIVTRKNFKLE